MPTKSKKPAARKPDPNTVSGQLRIILKARYDARVLTPYSVSQDAGLDPSVVNRFFKGERGLSSDSMDAVCAALGLRLTETRRGRPAGRPAPGPGPEPTPETGNVATPAGPGPGE